MTKRDEAWLKALLLRGTQACVDAILAAAREDRGEDQTR